MEIFIAKNWSTLDRPHFIIYSYGSSHSFGRLEWDSWVEKNLDIITPLSSTLRQWRLADERRHQQDLLVSYREVVTVHQDINIHSWSGWDERCLRCWWKIYTFSAKRKKREIRPVVGMARLCGVNNTHQERGKNANGRDSNRYLAREQAHKWLFSFFKST